MDENKQTIVLLLNGLGAGFALAGHYAKDMLKRITAMEQHRTFKEEVLNQLKWLQIVGVLLIVLPLIYAFFANLNA